MIHSPIVRTHQQEASHACVFLVTLRMELQERALVGEIRVSPSLCFVLLIFHVI